MEFEEFVRKPFIVNALEITEDNIAEVAEHVGTLRTKEDGTSYIHVDRRLIPNVFKVYPGFWMTKMGDNYRCYSAKIFNAQFVPITQEISEWVDFINSSADEDVAEEPETSTVVDL